MTKTVCADHIFHSVTLLFLDYLEVSLAPRNRVRKERPMPLLGPYSETLHSHLHPFLSLSQQPWGLSEPNVMVHNGGRYPIHEHGMLRMVSV